MRLGLHGADERLIDATKLSKDQNTSVTIVDLTEDGAVLAYGVRVGGADEQEVHFMNLATRKESGDVLPSARYYGAHVSPDKKGVYYSKFFPHEGTQVFYHPFGTATTSDAVIFGREYKGEKLGEIDGVGVQVTANGHYLVLSVGHGVPAKREDILLKDLRVANAPIVPLVYGVESRFNEYNLGDQFYVDTDYGAPNHRILKAEMGKSPDKWQTIVPESKDVIEEVSLVDRKLYVLRLKDVKSELTAYSLDGKGDGAHQFSGYWGGHDAGRTSGAEGWILQLFNRS